MKDYFNRRTAINNKLLALAKKLKEKGCDVYVDDHMLEKQQVLFLNVCKGDQYCTVSWKEVPYRWDISSFKDGKYQTLITGPAPSDNSGLFSASEVLGKMKQYNYTPHKIFSVKL